MRLKTLALALALTVAVPLGGCAQFQSLFGGGSVGQTVQPTLTGAEKGLTITHLAYQGVGTVLISGAQSGALHGSAAATAKAAYDKAGAFLDTADKADDAANAQGVFDAVSQAQDLIAQVKNLAQPATK